MTTVDGYRPDTNDVPLLTFSQLLIGPSGSGKTEAIRDLLLAGKRVAIGDLEGKTERLRALRPLIIRCPDIDALGTTLQLLETPAARRAYVKEATNGEWDDVDVFALDSLVEYEWMSASRIDREFEHDTRKGWGVFGARFVNLVRRLRDLATEKTVDEHGIAAPISVLATLPLLTVANQVGGFTEVMPIRGNIAAPRLAPMFSYVFHLRTKVVDGDAHWIADTVGEWGSFVAKGPGTDVLSASVDITHRTGTRFSEVWARLEKHITSQT